MPPSTGLRARVRAELIDEIKDEARRQLARDGAASLSLRAVTRQLGMASSGIYRYFPSREALLTALIIDAYDAVGGVAEAADAALDRADVGGRFWAVCHAVRRWALDHPHEYALVYGSPVPGYRAPEDTVGPASRVTIVLSRIVQDASDDRSLRPATVEHPLPPLAPAAADEGRRFAELAFPSVDEVIALRALAVWTQLFGMVSFELFGHFHGVVDDPEPVFDRVVLEAGGFIGLPAPGQRGPEGWPDGDDEEEPEAFYLI